MEDNVAFMASDVSRLFRKRFEFATRDLGITVPQWRALARIERSPGINQGALAGLLEVEPITVARMIDRLEKLGLVERRPNPSDRRAWLLYLTERAASLLRRLLGRAEDVIAESTSTFDEDELSLLVSLLSRMRKQLLELNSETADAPSNG